MTSTDLEQRVADAVRATYDPQPGTPNWSEHYKLIARAAIAAVFEALEVTDEILRAAVYAVYPPDVIFHRYELERIKVMLKAAITALKGEL